MLPSNMINIINVFILFFLIIVAVFVLSYFAKYIIRHNVNIFGGSSIQDDDEIWIENTYNDAEKALIKETCKLKPRKFERSDLYIDLDEKLPISYREFENSDAFVTRVHQGQRKLFLCELYFLTEFGHLSDTIVYAGAAPGHHTVLLSELFPKHKFHLYDPRDVFDERFKNNDMVNTYVQFFTDEDAKNWDGKDVLFMSDIRISVNDYDARELQISADMDMQMNWVKNMNPIKSLLKFRLPWDRSNVDYLNGDLIYQQYPSRYSSESRLIVDKDYKMINYNGKAYDDAMYKHNIIDREWMRFKVDKPFYNNSWDNACEEFIINNYCDKMKSVSDNKIYTFNYVYNKIKMGKIDPYNLKDKNMCKDREEIYNINIKKHESRLLDLRKKKENKVNTYDEIKKINKEKNK